MIVSERDIDFFAKKLGLSPEKTFLLIQDPDCLPEILNKIAEENIDGIIDISFPVFVELTIIKYSKDLNDKTFSDFISLRKEVEIESRKHQQEIADLALKVSTTYVTKESFEAYFDRIEAKLDRNFETIQQYLMNKK